MNSSIDTSQLLKTYESIRKDLALTNASKSIKNLNDAFEHISRREMQLNYIIEISEKLINRIESGQDSAILNKYMTEIKNLRLEVQKLEKNQGANNLFTVEVYQTELEELKKDYSDKVKNLEKQLEELQSCKLQKNYIELRKKYGKAKDQLLLVKKRYKEFEEIALENNQQKNMIEDRYLALASTQKKMCGYVEKLEEKLRLFQEKHKKSFSNHNKSYSREFSLSSPQINDDSKLLSFSIVGPAHVFSCNRRPVISN